MGREYRIDIDVLKGISIIAVVLYHVGVLPYGYLGVDTFLVINGFLIIPNLINFISNNTYSFFDWFVKRIFRFLPIITMAFLVCLIIGYFTMIPDDYENLSQSIVASGLFSNNILSAITTKNYWDVTNEFKPLMHFWYLGVIVQFYFVFPLILLFVKKKSNNAQKYLSVVVLILGCFSFMLYLIPEIDFSDKFYFLPFRVWEFSAGGGIGLLVSKRQIKIPNLVYMTVLLLLAICFCTFPKKLSEVDSITIVGLNTINYEMISKEFMQIGTVLLTSILLLKKKIKENVLERFVAILGRMSLSIFVWHQIILAFLRYAWIDSITWKVFIGFVCILSIISILSYKYLEVFKFDSSLKKFINLALLLLLLLISFGIYRNAGVVRDVPELDITVEHPFVNRNTEYIDQIYSYNKPFTSNDKLKVLVVGNSFARDFACVLLEWDTDSLLELSYQFSFEDGDDERLRECDYLFCFGSKASVPSEVWNTIKKDCKVYGIGTKSYGKTFGRIYARRYKEDYYKATIPLHPLCDKLNQEWKNSWGEDNYIDFMEVSKNEDGRIRLFTDNNKVISFDCRHLTKNGARYYARKIDFETIFN